MRVALVPRSAEIKPLFWRFVFETLLPPSSTYRVGAELGPRSPVSPDSPVFVRGLTGQKRAGLKLGLSDTHSPLRLALGGLACSGELS